MVGRLFQIVYLLMERESITASELAEKLEVSIRTINRDIDKLSEARIPIYTTKGRGGGISLLPDFVLNKKVLTEEEKSGILSSMRLLGTVAYEDEKEALSRLEDFFGETARDWIEIELDNWGEGVFDKDLFKKLKDAILTRKKVVFDYSKLNETNTRTVRPAKLIFKAQSWYLYGYCELRNDFRYFKFHRMNNIFVSDERFEPLDLPEVEDKYYESKEPTFDAVVEIDKKMAYRVYDECAREKITENDDKLILSVEGAKASWFYQYFLSYGSFARVISPPEIRDEMKHRITKMHDLYQ